MMELPRRRVYLPGPIWQDRWPAMRKNWENSLRFGAIFHPVLGKTIETNNLNVNQLINVLAFRSKKHAIQGREVAF